MLNSDYEKAYISTFAKIFTVLKDEYELYVKNGEYENYEIEVKAVNSAKINDYLSICFQKQNASFTIIHDNNIDKDIIDKLIKDICYAINDNYICKYNFKDLKDYTIYHFSYLKENIIIDNNKIIEDLKKDELIENISFPTNSYLNDSFYI